MSRAGGLRFDPATVVDADDPSEVVEEDGVVRRSNFSEGSVDVERGR